MIGSRNERKKESLKWICYSYNDERAEEKKILLDE
jgi:hypothetical protein